MNQYVYIITPVIAWAIAQGAKHLFVHYNRKRKIIDQPKASSVLLPIAPSGGMPSAHSATVVALTAIIGMKDGINTPAFAVSLLFMAVVMYDAMMVRYSSGEQGEAILSILRELKTNITHPKVAKGHLPSEVAVGAIIGIATALVVFFVTR